MFTGIIERIGKVSARSGAQVQIETAMNDLVLGESVSVNGVCLTVAELDARTAGLATFHISPETFARTNLEALAAGRLVNLERALLPTTRLSGHLVQGHVDGQARLERIEREGDCYALELTLPAGLSRYCVEKGSIALDGVSLTLNALRENRISLMLIPHTWTHTAFSQAKINDPVNVEVDVTAKYLEKLCQPYLSR